MSNNRLPEILFLQTHPPIHLPRVECLMEGVTIEEEVTPLPVRCLAGTCQSVFRLSDGNLLIVGKKISSELRAQIQHKVAEDEFAIMIAPEYLPK